MKDVLVAIITAFQNGGDFMYVILYLDKLLLVMTIILLIINKRKALLFGLIAALLPLALGCIAYFSSMHYGELAIQYADPDNRANLQDAIWECSIIPLKFGIYSTLVFFIPIYVRFYLYKRTQTQQANRDPEPSR